MKRIGKRRKGILWDYNRDGQESREKWTTYWKRYWKKWMRREGKQETHKQDPGNES